VQVAVRILLGFKLDHKILMSQRFFSSFTHKKMFNTIREI
jgi:hypothetical protein